MDTDAATQATNVAPESLVTYDAVTRATIYGPYTNINTMPTAAMNVMLIACGNAYTFNAVTYNGESCFKFVSGTTTVYVKAQGLYQASSLTSYPTASSVSSTLTSNINSGNTNEVISTMTRGTYAAGLPGWQWDIVQTTSAAGFFENDQITVKTNVLREFSLLVNGGSITVQRNSSVMPKPYMDCKITNTGSYGICFGGYYIKGSGGSASTTDISRLINLGYTASQLVGSVSSLSATTFYNLYNLSVALNGGSSYYESENKFLTNSANNKYSYSCGMQSPFVTNNVNDYYQMQIGIMGIRSSATRFSVSVNFNFQ